MYYVYYSDGYPEDGGQGLKEFTGLSYCESFIMERMSQDDKRVIGNYAVIKGGRLTVESIEVVKKIKIT